LVRGVAGPAELPREQQLIQQLRRLRERVVIPDPDATVTTGLTRGASSW
jgi:hypothetical protein